MTLWDTWMRKLHHLKAWLQADRKRLAVSIICITAVLCMFLYSGIQKDNMHNVLASLDNAYYELYVHTKPGEYTSTSLDRDSEYRYILCGYRKDASIVIAEKQHERHPLGWNHTPLRLLQESNPYKADMTVDLPELMTLLTDPDPLSRVSNEIQGILKQPVGILSVKVTDPSLSEPFCLYTAWETHPVIQMLQKLFLIGVLMACIILAYRYIRYLNKSQKQQERSVSTLRRDSLNAIAHQIRTPLAAMLGYAEAIELDICPEKEDWYLSQIKAKGNEISELIDQILSIGQLASASESTSREEISVYTLLSDCIRQFPMAEFSVEVTEDFSILTDRRHMERMLLCLLDNAVRYHKADTPISITLKDRTLRIHNICDPLSQEFLKDAFAFHVQSDGHYSFGLYYAKKVAEAYDLHLYLFNDKDGVTVQLT